MLKSVVFHVHVLSVPEVVALNFLNPTSAIQYAETFSTVSIQMVPCVLAQLTVLVNSVMLTG